jgi:hypothetical protein
MAIGNRECRRSGTGRLQRRLTDRRHAGRH